MLFDVDFITYRGLYRSIKTDKLNIPCIDGRRTILSNHMAIILPIENGVIQTSNDGVLSHYVVSEGMVYFENNKATVICDVVEDIEKADINYYENRIADAKNKLSVARNDADIKKATIKLTRATNIVENAKRLKR